MATASKNGESSKEMANVVWGTWDHEQTNNPDKKKKKEKEKGTSDF